MAEAIPEQIDCVSAEEARAIYVPPVLRALGDVRDLTLGGSPGTGDSGNPSLQQF